MSQKKSSALDALVKGSGDPRAHAELEALRRVEFWARALVRASETQPALALRALHAAGAELEAAVAALG
jgi:hypothetical protein